MAESFLAEFAGATVNKEGKVTLKLTCDVLPQIEDMIGGVYVTLEPAQMRLVGSSGEVA